jgi:hypothetical protein
MANLPAISFSLWRFARDRHRSRLCKPYRDESDEQAVGAVLNNTGGGIWMGLRVFQVLAGTRIARTSLWSSELPAWGLIFRKFLQLSDFPPGNDYVGS